jgi:hypothetical protein
MEHFRNDGYGWTCSRCNDEQERAARQQGPRARFFSEGEAEERDLKLTTAARARWRDATRQILFCPSCGVEERMQD